MNNLEIFDIKTSIKRFNEIEIDETPFYFSCKKCKKVPNIFLSDDKNLFIYCEECGKKANEKIENIVNYNSEWITNEIIKFCNTKHEDKILSVIFCKTCNLFLCEECLNQHKENNESHEFIELNKLKINFCNFHNKKLTQFCFDCNEEICKKCLNKHKEHKTKKIEKNIENKNLEKFNNFLEKIENSINNKYQILKKNIIELQNLKINDEESKEQLNIIIQKNLDFFYKDLKIGQNLLFLSKILFISSEKIKEFSEIRKKQNEMIIENILNYFDEKNLEKFKMFINKEKSQLLTYLDKFSEKEIEILNKNIESIFEPKKNENVSDFDKTKDFIEKNIDFSNELKKFITIEKMNNPENYVDIDKTLDKFENISKEINSNESDYVLSLVGKILEKNGTEMNISKNKNEKLNKIELTSLQYLFTLGNKKKFELHFDFGEEQNKKIFSDPLEKEKFLKEYKKKISEKLQINEENLILTNIHHGCVGVDVSILNQNINDANVKNNLQQIEGLKKVDEKPMLESLQISKDVLDAQGDRKDGWGIDEMRGGEKYIPPIKGWYGIGLKVLNQYDNGNNDWLDYNNNEDEFSIAYLGINNFLNNKEKIVEDLNKFSKDINKMVVEKLYQNENDLRKNGNKCGDGICLFQNPDYAENSAGIIDIYGYRIKIILMCRVNPKKIRQPQNFPDCWILNPTPDEIRPYRILFKKIPISPMAGAANDAIITCTSPVDYIISSINSNDFSFYDLEQQYKEYSTINGQNLDNHDFFVLKLYSSNYYTSINNYLRNKQIEHFTEEQIKSWICCLQLALKRNLGVKDDTIVYRGIRKFKFPSEIGIGSQFYFREFFSTSLSEDVAKGFAGYTPNGSNNKGTIMVITIKNNGTNGHSNYCYDITELSCFKNEKEILLSSHCYFLVTNIIRNNSFDYAYLTCQGYLLD